MFIPKPEREVSKFPMTDRTIILNRLSRIDNIEDSWYSNVYSKKISEYGLKYIDTAHLLREDKGKVLKWKFHTKISYENRLLMSWFLDDLEKYFDPSNFSPSELKAFIDNFLPMHGIYREPTRRSNDFNQKYKKWRHGWKKRAEEYGRVPTVTGTDPFAKEKGY